MSCSLLRYLTAADREELMAFAKAERQDLEQAKDPELETLMKDLDSRHAQEAFDLSARHDLERQGPIEGIARPHTLERQEQNKKFAEEPAPAPVDLTLYAPKPAASKFLSPELAQKLDPLPAPPTPAAPEAKPFDYELYANYNRKPAPPAPAPMPVPSPAPQQPPAIDPALHAPKPKAEEPQTSLPPQSPQQPVAPQDAALEALKKAIVERQAEDARKWADDNALQLQRLENDLTAVNAGKAKDFEAIQAGERAALKRRHQKEQRTGLKGLLDTLQGKVNPALAADTFDERFDLTDADRRFRQELEEQEKLLVRDQSREPKLEDLEKKLADRQAQESHDLALAQTAELNRFGPSQELTERHRQEWEEQTKDFAKERDRYVEEFHESRRMLEELRAREKTEALERGHEPDEGLGFSH